MTVSTKTAIGASRALQACARARLARRRSLIGLTALALSSLCLAPAAKAEILQFSATDFVLRCANCNSQDDRSEINNGVLITQNNNSVFYKSVVFPRNNEMVCSFSLVYHDINASDSIVARLFRKGYAVGGDPFAPPKLMASVSSASGTPDTVRVATTTAIASRTIQAGSAFYYVEIASQTFNLNILGVRIDVRPTCP